MLKLAQIVPASSDRFDDVKDALRERLSERRISERRDKWLGDLADKAVIKRMF